MEREKCERSNAILSNCIRLKQHVCGLLIISISFYENHDCVNIERCCSMFNPQQNLNKWITGVYGNDVMRTIMGNGL